MEKANVTPDLSNMTYSKRKVYERDQRIVDFYLKSVEEGIGRMVIYQKLSEREGLTHQTIVTRLKLAGVFTPAIRNH